MNALKMRRTYNKVLFLSQKLDLAHLYKLRSQVDILISDLSDSSNRNTETIEL